MRCELFWYYFLRVIKTKNWNKLLNYFDSNNRILITLSILFYIQFVQMDGTLPI